MVSHLDSFIPAQTIAEAIQRIHALTGSTDTGRGEKRAVVALRDALELDIDIVRTNAAVGEIIAESLGVDWDHRRHTAKTKLTLDGLNQLLCGATITYRQGKLRRVSVAPAGLVGPDWTAFNPARNKLEAVTRIASLTNSPRESLGPGSKERKSVLVNLSMALFPNSDTSLSKTRLGESLANSLGVNWTDSCYSTGETVSLEGLNLILAGAERKLGRLGDTALSALGTPQEEGAALAWALRQGIEDFWDGKDSIRWMADNGVRGSKDNEWQGFYFEAKAREVLGSAFSPPLVQPRVKYGNTTFDYSLNHVWDLKAHTAFQIDDVRKMTRKTPGSLILNDANAIRSCVEEQGLGFLIGSGTARMDLDGSFVTWHRQFKGKPAKPSNSTSSRTRKVAFMPTSVEAFWIDNTPHLNSLISGGQLKFVTQGRQPPRRAGESGAPRADKVLMTIRTSRDTDFKVAGFTWG